jgi:gas vesicle protein
MALRKEISKMPNENQGLGRTLLETQKDVINLMNETTDPDRLNELAEMAKELSRQISELVEANLNAADERYKAATSGLQEASEVAKAAIKGLESIKNAIDTLSKALELVAKLLA